MARVASYLLSRQRHLRHGCPAAALRNSKSLHLIRGSLLPLKFSLLLFPQMFPAPQSQTTQRIRPTPPPNSAEHTTVFLTRFRIIPFWFFLKKMEYPSKNVSFPWLRRSLSFY